MYIIYILILFYIFIISIIIAASITNKEKKYLDNFNYDYIEKLDLASIIILKDYIYKIIKLKKPLQVYNGREKKEKEFINKLKKTIEMQIYFIKMNKDHPKYTNKYLNNDKIKDLLIYINYYYKNPLKKFMLIEKRAHYIYLHKEHMKDYQKICNLSALYTNDVPPPLDISDYY